MAHLRPQPGDAPHYVAKDAHVQNSLVAEGCNVYGEIDFAVLFAGVYVAPGAVVKDSIVMPGARIEEGAGCSTPSWRRTLW